MPFHTSRVSVPARRSNTRAAQRGLGGLGLFIVIAMALMVVIVGLRVTPSYLEYWRVKRALEGMNSAGVLQGGSESDIRKAFERRAEVDDIHSLRPADLEISKPNGRMEVAANYESRVALTDDITLVIAFHATATANATAP